MKDSYINISKAFSSSLIERIGTSTILNSFVPIKQIAEAKGLKSTRSLRLEINKPESKYISREVKVNGGISYKILFSSLEPELQQKLREAENKSTEALLSKTKVIYPDFYPLLFTTIFTGMRKGEMLALTWDSINWITQKITVDKNYTHGRLGTPKTGKIRVIDMSNELAKVLKEWRLACPHSELNLVFPISNGNYQSADNLAKRRFLPALNRAGIDKIRFHDLRHTYASLLLANGAPMKYVQHQLGHSSISMTMDLYTHLLPEVNDKCVNLLNNIVSSAVESKGVIEKYGT